jgi:hypothetical protein
MKECEEKVSIGELHARGQRASVAVNRVTSRAVEISAPGVAGKKF